MHIRVCPALEALGKRVRGTAAYNYSGILNTGLAQNVDRSREVEVSTAQFI
jgi:hypothetical protein